MQRFVNLQQAIGINHTQLQENLARGYDSIMKLQNPDGGFKYWENDFTSDIEITPFVLRNLTELKNAGYAVDEKKIDAVTQYLSRNANENVAVSLRLEALWAVAKYMPQQEEKVLSLFGIRDIQNLEPSNPSQHELLSYTYALYYLDAQKYKTQISQNIEILYAGKLPVKYGLYSSNTEDRAILAQLMLDV